MIETPEQYLDVVSNSNERKLILRFLRNPVELIPSAEDPSKLGTVKLQRMKLSGPASKQQAIASEDPDSTTFSDLKCDAFIKSIGYKSLPIPGLPFDERRHTIPHSYGCIEDTQT